jgi:putative heme-binding domain-containing protein
MSPRRHPALGIKANGLLAKLTADPGIAAWAIRALTDREDQLADVPAQPLLAGLHAPNPRTRREAVVSLARLGRVEHANAVVGLLGDPDPVVAHTAVQALKRLEAAEACFAVVDTAGATPQERAAALRVLQSLHKPLVVDGLIERLNRESDPERRAGLITALCRLHFIPGPWKGNSWGTRPDTSGPYYQPETWSETSKIARALQSALFRAEGAEANFVLAELNRHKVQLDDALEGLVALAGREASLIPAAMEQLARADSIPSKAFPLLARTATEPSVADVPRAQAVMALSKSPQPDAVKTMLTGLALLEKRNRNGADREGRLAREAFLSASSLAGERAFLETQAAALTETSVFADAALLVLADGRKTPPEARESARNALNLGWTTATRRAQILRAVQWADHRQYKNKILEALNDPDAGVAQAARGAARTLRLDLAKLNSNPPAAQTLSGMNVSDVIAAVLKTHGQVKTGEELFTRQGCVNCHTVRADEPPRGPFLGNLAATYKRPELAENILIPSKTIAQGFVGNHFELKDGTEYDGFVTLEAADKVVIRNTAAQEIIIPVKDIAKRDKLAISIMPEGLVANLSVEEFASLLDYLEALARK